MSTIWLDIKSPSDTHFLAAFARHLEKDHDLKITVRDRAEAIALAKQYKLDFLPVGKDDPRRALKVINYAKRVLQLKKAVGHFDVSLSFNNMNAILLAKLARKPSITFMDNDLEFDAAAWSVAKRGEMAINLRADRIVVPDVFPFDQMVRMGAKRDAIVPFDGFKEDFYVADFTPDPEFRKMIPFDDYVVVRPEARSAAYVLDQRSIVPELIEHLLAANEKVVYLPRVSEDWLLAPDHRDVFIPEKPLNGLQLSHHSKAVMTGSGSFAREAACLGVKSISFFPNRLLAVDRKMVDKGWVLHSRDVPEIVNHVTNGVIQARDVTATREARAAVVTLAASLLREMGVKAP